MSDQPPDGPLPEEGDREGWDWKLPDESGAGATALPATRSFRSTVLLTVAGTVLPGLGLIAARRRVVGGIVLGVFALAVLGFGGWALFDLQGFLGQFVQPAVLLRLTVVLVVVGLIWVGVVVASHLSLRGRPSRSQRVTGGLLVGVLAFAVAAPVAVAARYSYDTAATVQGMFKSEKDSQSATRPTLKAPKASKGQTAAPDPWADKPRLNILLLGGDAGKGRTGTRTDTVILASVDTKTGDTTLFSLPRNTANMPFPKSSPLHRYYPNGFSNGNGDDQEFALNAIYQNVPATVPKDVLGPTDNLGADVLKLSVGEALGLKVDYYALIDLKGFSTLVDALGGIRVNINSYIPIGGNTDLHIPATEFLHPGPNQKLDGRSALWYARGRYGSTDFARMDRQRCVINAIIKQASPTTLLSRYEDIAKAGKQIVKTDVPQEVLPLLVDLGLRVKNGNVRSIVFRHGEDGFLSYDPDFDRMRERVKAAIGETKTVKSSSGPSKKNSSGSKKKATESESVDDSCAFDPQMAATATPYRG
jgi:LCP family protein required for cell wall assembly